MTLHGTLVALLAINYFFAFVYAHNVTDDTVWAKLLSTLIASRKTDEEKTKLMADEQKMRKIFTIGLMVPGVGLIMATRTLKK